MDGILETPCPFNDKAIKTHKNHEPENWSCGQLSVIHYAKDLGLASFFVSLLFPFEKGCVCTEREN